MIDALIPLMAVYLLIAIAILMWPELQAAGVIIRELWRTWLLRNWRLIATGDYLAWAIDAHHPGPPFCELCNGHIDGDGDCACVYDFKLCPNMDCMAVVADESTHCSLCGTRISQRFTEDEICKYFGVKPRSREEQIETIRQFADGKLGSGIDMGVPVSQALLDSAMRSIIRDLQDLSDTAHLELRDRARLAAIISRLEQLP